MDNNNELKHYGVLGMKWGVRKANKEYWKVGSDEEKAKRIYSKVYSKSTTKANKLNRKAVNKNLKSAKLQKKAFKKESKATNEKQQQKARQMQFKANKLRLKSAKLQKKAMKWEKKMEGPLSYIKVSDVSKESLASGKKYTYMLFDDSKSVELYRKHEEMQNKADRAYTASDYEKYAFKADKYFREAVNLESELDKKRKNWR